VFVVAGLNHLPDVVKGEISGLGARLIVGKGDMAIVADGMKARHEGLRTLDNKE